MTDSIRGSEEPNRTSSVVYGTDKNFWPQVYVSLYSLLRSNPGRRWRAFIICDRPDRTFRARVKRLRSFGNLAEITLIPISDLGVDLSTAPLQHHLTTATYFRLLVGKALPTDVRRVLYLDSDTVVNQPIDALVDADLGGRLLAAVENHSEPRQNRMRLGLPDDVSYFNAGVLLIDLEKWRRIGADDQLFAFIKANPERLDWADQDALNSLFHRDWAPFGQEFNYQTVGRAESP